MKNEFLIVPVLPTSDMGRDVAWYKEKMGLDTKFADKMYAVLYRENLWIHLQWHADTEDHPLLGGSVIRIHVKNLKPLYEEFMQRGTITADKLKTNTPWNTNEFGFYDLNRNAIFFAEDLNGRE
jgi:hypothetical protein